MRHQAAENTIGNRARYGKPQAVPAAAAEHAPATARQVGLRYVSDEAPGITRKPAKNGFHYLDRDGKPLKDEATLARIKSLAKPPTKTKNKKTPKDNGHIQATGRDA